MPNAENVTTSRKTRIRPYILKDLPPAVELSAIGMTT
jgi:hypothetical protein